MFGFAISLRSKHTAQNWERTILLLARTLDSVVNQSNPEFRAVVACHELPENLPISDDRISFVQVDYRPPIYRDEWNADKQRKRELATITAFRDGCSYIMPLDADDLVSDRLVDFVLNDQGEYGYLIETGYEFSFERDCFTPAPRLSRICGSCGIFRWQEGELPSEPWQLGDFIYRDQVNTIHPKWRERGEKIGRPLKTVPFPALTYVLDTGQNLSVMRGNVSPRRNLIRRFAPKVRNDEALRKEFGLARASWQSKQANEGLVAAT